MAAVIEATETTDASVVDIPFLIRGKVVEPGEDAVEYSGRSGARFRTPDPRKWANELVLADAGDLADLRETKIDEIVDFLVELGGRLRLADNPLLQKSYRLALDAGDLTEPLLDRVYSEFVEWFEGDRLRDMVAEVGKDFLDGWVELGAPGRSSMRMRAIGTRQLHIIAGNHPVTTTMTVIRTALTKGDSLIKMPSNDPFSAGAIVQSMIDLDPNHPVTKHFAVAYWKGGDEDVERQIIRPSRIEKLTAWGGMTSMRHIQKYLVPGIELIAFNPKWSISVVGHEALESDEAMQDAARGVAASVGAVNQTGCGCTRVVYVECTTDDDDLARLEQLGTAIHAAYADLPEWYSTIPKRPDPGLQAELDALALEEEFYRVIGDATYGGVIVSRTEDEVEFVNMLNNRVTNLVPVDDITRASRYVRGDETQTVLVYPESLRERIRDDLATYGVQHIGSPKGPRRSAGARRNLNPHDGIEPLRRMVRWVTDESGARS